MRGQHFTSDVVAAWVLASCEGQGVPAVVTDADVLADVVVLLTGRAAPPRPQRGSAGSAGRPAVSEPPDGGDAVGIDALGSGFAGADDGMVQDGRDDLGLTG